jgi:hypothetical protein
MNNDGSKNLVFSCFCVKFLKQGFFYFISKKRIFIVTIFTNPKPVTGKFAGNGNKSNQSFTTHLKNSERFAAAEIESFRRFGHSRKKIRRQTKHLDDVSGGKRQARADCGQRA